MRRRRFLQSAAGGGAVAMTAVSAKRVYGANSRVNVALVGCGGRGTAVAQFVQKAGGANYIAMCDVYDPHAVRAKAALGGSASTTRDFRRVLDMKDVVSAPFDP